METSQTEIIAEKERQRDKRLRKTYGITLEQWRQIYDAQNGCCAICGRHFGTFNAPPNVDHRHIKIQVRRTTSDEVAYGLYKGWISWSDDIQNPNIPTGGFWARTKLQAIKNAKQFLARFCVRGLLCPGRHTKAMHGGCNRLLGRVDNREWLQKADAYLADPPARKVLDKNPNL